LIGHQYQDAKFPGIGHAELSALIARPTQRFAEWVSATVSNPYLTAGRHGTFRRSNVVP
jgi:hypothetical protein